ncbi:hypothetical protein BSYN_15500 [Bacteroides sedimenti]|uniref:Uncharacterized protein n=1 Tax=Bacteroides sedimenti TaxID=2136147 RepID=A0ABM8IB95_9BACE
MLKKNITSRRIVENLTKNITFAANLLNKYSKIIEEDEGTIFFVGKNIYAFYPFFCDPEAIIHVVLS